MLLLSSKVPIRCPSGSYNDSFNGIPNKKLKLNFVLDESQDAEKKMFDVLGYIYDFICEYNNTKKNTNEVEVKFPQKESEEYGNCTFFGHLICNNEGKLFTRVWNKNRELLSENTIPRCTATLGLTFSYPVTKNNIVYPRINISEMILEDDLDECVLDNEMLDG